MLVEFLTAPPLSRPTDDVCSHMAEQIVAPKIDNQKRLFIMSLSDLGQATAIEIAWASASNPISRESIRKRAASLVSSGKICASHLYTTLDGSAPTTGSTLYSSITPVTVSPGQTIKAIAVYLRD